MRGDKARRLESRRSGEGARLFCGMSRPEPAEGKQKLVHIRNRLVVEFEVAIAFTGGVYFA